ncbi:MAG: prolyl-tRNA synthetase associated domain-containing protein [Epulopiscium sp.]|nr:prolyl-tRNA synthetase associated domain-containing protein [Candidatus Epulonipiscium sp.]
MEEVLSVYKLLEELDIQYKKYEHAPAFTMEDINELDINIEGEYCKNLFLRNSKGNQHYLVIVSGSKTVDLKKLAREIPSTRLSFASDERLYKYLKLKPGSVSPFGLIHDNDQHVEIVIDQDIVGLDLLCFHPNINTATVVISYDDFYKYLKSRGNKIHFVQI